MPEPTTKDRSTPAGAAASANAPAWSARDLADPHAAADKDERVRRMFAAIARSYDLNNRVHSLWRDQAWRRTAVKAAGLRGGERVLDCACGTGDLTQWFARRGAGEVVGLDFTPEMLDLARAKQTRPRSQGLTDEQASRITYVQGDAMSLPFDDASFDVVSIAFGIRNVKEPARAVAEFARVLRPGGRLVILEFTRPANPVVRAFNALYCERIMPVTATLIARDTSGAYRYLPRSVSGFMSRDALEAEMARAGFAQVRSRPLSLGICACYSGVRTDRASA